MGNFFSQDNEPTIMRNIRNQKNYEFYFTNQRYFASPYLGETDFCFIDDTFIKK